MGGIAKKNVEWRVRVIFDISEVLQNKKKTLQ